MDVIRVRMTLAEQKVPSQTVLFCCESFCWGNYLHVVN
jgi:hypothetical protein